ncbi:pyrroline-5-carboxylate reductase [Helicobacter cynogastricus]|uniref:pyrroline-5-carboxylate reductase n=1 Tax=Helicobacter cynogastricus TaxID=329937 RepID=UPI000CF1A87D|nr:pyrroline-5-carboxylate reductase [Helicobacter cynogastricus]
MKTRLLIVGYGNMARAILKGFAKNASKLTSYYDVEVTGRNAMQFHYSFLQALPFEVRYSSTDDIIDIDQDTIVLLTIKPHALGSYRYEGKASAVLSVLAGVSVEDLAKHIDSQAYVRCMPNIAARYGLSATTMYTPHYPLLQRRDIRELLRFLGNIVEVSSESLIDASLATNGSSLAFLSMVAQALVSAGVREGLSVNQASELVEQSFKGFAQLLEEQNPQEIIDSICTPGGATIAGLSVLEEKAFKGILMQACHIAVRKGRTKFRK